VKNRLRSLPAAVRRDWADLATATTTPSPFDPASVAGLPDPVRRWLTHAIAPGTILSRSVELEQHGRIRLGSSWHRYRATEVIAPLRGYVWAATTRMFGVPVHGHDRLTRGTGEMVHRAFGRFSLVHADGADLSRSAAGRLAGEIVWAPAAAIGPEVLWRPVDVHTAVALVPYGGGTDEVRITVAPSGALQTVVVERWAAVGRDAYRLHPFTATVDRETSFAGYTLPVQVSAGYEDGAFITITVDAATFH
jgi:hypothetical protein